MENAESANLVIKEPSLADFIAGATAQVLKEKGLSHKSQKKDGGFSGDVAIPPRDEEWMHEEVSAVPETPLPTGAGVPLEKPCSTGSVSYKDALKPGQSNNKNYPMDEVVEEYWDGNLVDSDEDDMKIRVTVTDTEVWPRLEFSEKEKQRLEKKWGKSLIIKLLGGSIGYMQLRRRVQLMWGKAGTVELSDIGNDFFIASFQDIDDYFFALEGGPCLINNHYLTVQTWKRNFNSRAEKIRNIAIWVRLPGLPGDYYDRKFFYNLGNKIGKAIKVDEMTLRRARTMYARMCVEIDLNAPLVPAYEVDENLLKIEYEGLHQICFSCGKFGHEESHCPKKKEELQNKSMLGGGQNQTKDGEGPQTEVGGGNGYGEWMKVNDQRKGRKRGQRESSKKSSEGQNGRQEMQNVSSRFAVLSELESDKATGGDKEVPQDVLHDVTNIPPSTLKGDNFMGPKSSTAKLDTKNSEKKMSEASGTEKKKEKVTNGHDRVHSQISQPRGEKGAKNGSNLGQKHEFTEINTGARKAISLGHSEENKNGLKVNPPKALDIKPTESPAKDGDSDVGLPETMMAEPNPDKFLECLSENVMELNEKIPPDLNLSPGLSDVENQWNLQRPISNEQPEPNGFGSSQVHN
ncbi:hypothetical protein VNO77_10303 [Canavalia gladiata]|uniref:CCHC-type domain-containing protein n=1 Tax=Canavalia gladiata TaxID=3824 RepID=A0AAN9MGT6_CANGL